jgi:hypothetical protein
MTSPVNPYAPLPNRTSSPELVSGGGADGQIDHVVGLLLLRVLPRQTGYVTAQPDPSGARTFDLAELISQCARQAGVATVLPTRADRLLLLCRSQRTMIDVSVGLATKGALMFGQNVVGLSLGVHRKVIVYSGHTGLIVDRGIRLWTQAARMPGARGYR